MKHAHLSNKANGKWTIYNNFSELGISQNTSIIEVFKAMPDNSTLIAEISSSVPITNYPYSSGMLEAIRCNAGRSSFKFTLPVGKFGTYKIYEGSCWQDVWSGWHEITIPDSGLWTPKLIAYDYANNQIYEGTISTGAGGTFEKTGNLIIAKGWLTVSSLNTSAPTECIACIKGFPIPPKFFYGIVTSFFTGIQSAGAGSLISNTYSPVYGVWLRRMNGSTFENILYSKISGIVDITFIYSV